MTLGFSSSSSIKGSNEMLGFELLPLSRVRSIEDGALRFCHVARKEEASHNHVSPIINRHLRCHHASMEVYRAHLISTCISSDERVRLSHFKIESSPN